MTEEWRDVVGFEGAYQVSDLGRVRSLDRIQVNSLGHARSLRGRVLVSVPTSRGYRCTKLGVKKWLAIHVAVCAAFYGPKPTAAHEVAHSDSDPSNNRADNLSWKLHVDNLADREALGRVPRGESHGSAKLDNAMVATIRRRTAAGELHRVIALDYAVTRNTVSDIGARRTWSHV